MKKNYSKIHLKNEVGFELDSSAAKQMDISPRNFSNLLSYCKLAGKFCSSVICWDIKIKKIDPSQFRTMIWRLKINIFLLNNLWM